jgi:hypothetical protein
MKRDGFLIMRSEQSGISCERIQIREVSHIPVHSRSGFGAGPRDGWSAADLSIAILAELLDASREPEAYRVPPTSGNEHSVWALHRAFCARWITPLILEVGDFVELPRSRLEEWLAVEAPWLPHAE